MGPFFVTFSKSSSTSEYSNEDWGLSNIKLSEDFAAFPYLSTWKCEFGHENPFSKAFEMTWARSKARKCAFRRKRNREMAQNICPTICQCQEEDKSPNGHLQFWNRKTTQTSPEFHFLFWGTINILWLHTALFKGSISVRFGDAFHKPAG